MSNGYSGFNMPNRGLQTGSAFMQSMFDAYNRNTLMMADIQRFKTSTAFREREFGLAERRADIAEERFEFEKGGGAPFGRAPWYTSPKYKDTKMGRIGGGIDPRAATKLQIGGKLSPEEDLAIKYIGKLDAAKPPDPVIKDTLMQSLRENPSKVAKDYVIEKDKESGKLTSLETILKKYPQDTDRSGFLLNFDDTISPEDTRKGIAEYVEKLMDYGLTQEEAEVKAIEEFGALRKAEKYHPMKTYPQGDLFTGAAKSKIPSVVDRAGHLAEYRRLGGSKNEAARAYAEQNLQ